MCDCQNLVKLCQESEKRHDRFFMEKSHMKKRAKITALIPSRQICRRSRLWHISHPTWISSYERILPAVHTLFTVPSLTLSNIACTSFSTMLFQEKLNDPTQQHITFDMFTEWGHSIFMHYLFETVPPKELCADKDCRIVLL